MTCQNEGTRHADISTWDWRRGLMHIANLHSPSVRGSPAPLHIQSADDAGFAAHPGVWEGPGILWFSKTPPESLMCGQVETPLLGSRKVSIWLHFSDLDGQHSNLYVTAQASQPLGFRGPQNQRSEPSWELRALWVQRLAPPFREPPWSPPDSVNLSAAHPLPATVHLANPVE